jgi:hypothetical protein
MKSFNDIREKTLNVVESRNSISVGSADKKPENYHDKDGKMIVRMVPTKKTQVSYEAMGHIGDIQGMMAKEREEKKKRDDAQVAKKQKPKRMLKRMVARSLSIHRLTMPY